MGLKTTQQVKCRPLSPLNLQTPASLACILFSPPPAFSLEQKFIGHPSLGNYSSCANSSLHPGFPIYNVCIVTSSPYPVA